MPRESLPPEFEAMLASQFATFEQMKTHIRELPENERMPFIAALSYEHGTIAKWIINARQSNGKWLDD